jgi:hypothetical protein
MRSVLVSVFAAVVLVGSVAIAQGQDRARGGSDTSIFVDDDDHVHGDKWKFFGHLESGNPDCLPNRIVKMSKRDNGKWKFVDKDTTNATGHFVTGGKLPGEPPLKFTVKTKEVGMVTCGGDSIKPFSGPNR